MQKHFGTDSAEQPVPLEILLSWLIHKVLAKGVDDSTLATIRELCVDFVHAAADAAVHDKVLNWFLKHEPDVEEERELEEERARGVTFLSDAIHASLGTMKFCKQKLQHSLR